MREDIKVKSFTCLLAAAIVLVGFSGSRCLASLWGEGTLKASDGGLTTKDGWNPYDEDLSTVIEVDEDTILTWKITLEDGYYQYEYKFSTPVGSDRGALSHLSLQVTEDPVFDPTNPMDFFGFSGDLGLEVNADGDIEPSKLETGGPRDFWAIKFETGTTDEDTELTFNSLRVPMMGNFYAKDGRHPDPSTGLVEFAEAWNTVANTVGVPDSGYVPVPGAVLLGLLGLGAAGLKLRRFA